jgi:C-terminal processing protease CtpA/Prc
MWVCKLEIISAQEDVMTRKISSLITFIVSITTVFSPQLSAQNLKFERDRHKSILIKVKEDVKKYYFDPAFKGVDIEAKSKTAQQKIEAATSITQMNGIIAQFLLDFDDSHLFFIPAGKVNKIEYGFRYRMFGDKCLVYSVSKQSDAEKKGLQVGDEIYSLQGFAPGRDNLWKMNYFYRSLSPRQNLELDVIKPDGRNVAMTVSAKIKQGKQMMDLTGEDIFEFIREEETEIAKTKHYYSEKIEGVFVWRMPSFNLDPTKVDDIIGKASRSTAIVFDLRGNSGGRVDMLMRLIGNVFDKDIIVGHEKKRNSTKKLTAKSRGGSAFKGNIVVLVDSGSASASEVFGKVIQLEKRGKVIGERSAGAVMESMFFGREEGLDVVIFFGTSITIADLIMADGKSLEKTGVTPDITVIPTGSDMAARNDVVMSKALETLGIKMAPADAGKIFPESDKN